MLVGVDQVPEVLDGVGAASRQDVEGDGAVLQDAQRIDLRAPLCDAVEIVGRPPGQGSELLACWMTMRLSRPARSVGPEARCRKWAISAVSARSGAAWLAAEAAVARWSSTAPPARLVL
ncbi:hypothetical protein GCM10010400_38090 [Streptomyces aculeolatus]